MEMRFEDYLFSLQANQCEYDFIKSIFDEASMMLPFLHQHYRVLNASLTLKVDCSSSKRAKIRENTIVISRGIIDMLLSASGGAENFEDIDSSAFHGPDHFRRIGGVLWIVAHEFFHHARNHGSLWFSHSQLRKAFEYDADCCAVAGLYRYLEYRLAENFSSELIQSIVFDSFFWPIRQLIGLVDEVAVPVSHHADWLTRMNYSLRKLSCINVPHINYGATIDFQKQLRKLIERQIEHEKHFLEKSGVADSSKSIVLKELIRNASGDAGSAIREVDQLWEVAEPLVRKSSLLIADAFDGKSILFIGSGNGLTLGGWTYTSNTVSGSWMPKFHARLASLDSSFYGNPCIYPNAQWTAQVPDIRRFALGKSIGEVSLFKYRGRVASVGKNFEASLFANEKK